MGGDISKIRTDVLARKMGRTNRRKPSRIIPEKGDRYLYYGKSERGLKSQTSLSEKVSVGEAKPIPTTLRGIGK